MATKPSLTGLAIIPARGGSTGIPRKNLLPLAGKPLLAHTIEQARRANSVAHLVVSTNDTEIGAVAQAYGAEVVWRPAAISGDDAGSEAALLHVLDTLQHGKETLPELIIFFSAPRRLP